MEDQSASLWSKGHVPVEGWGKLFAHLHIIFRSFSVMQHLDSTDFCNGKFGTLANRGGHGPLAPHCQKLSAYQPLWWLRKLQVMSNVKPNTKPWSRCAAASECFSFNSFQQNITHGGMQRAVYCLLHSHLHTAYCKPPCSSVASNNFSELTALAWTPVTQLTTLTLSSMNNFLSHSK